MTQDSPRGPVVAAQGRYPSQAFFYLNETHAGWSVANGQ